MSRSRGTMRDYLNKTCASYNKMTSIKKHRIDGARKSLLYNLCLSLIGGQLVLFFPFNFGQENNLSCTWVELSRGSFLYHHDGLIKGCDPPKTSWTWCTATTIPILISNQAWFRKHIFQGFFFGLLGFVHLGQDCRWRYWPKSFGCLGQPCEQNAHSILGKRRSVRFSRRPKRQLASMQSELLGTLDIAEQCFVSIYVA